VSYVRDCGRFQCKRCGWCCQNQLISVSTVEIRAIINLMSRRSLEEFEDHITSCLAYENSLNPYALNFKKGLNRLLNFFEPYEIEVFEGDIALAKNHIITLLPKTRICVFYNSLSSSCFIYPARPLTCRMFPYEVEGDQLVMVNEADKCPGIGIGEVVNIRRHRRLSTMCKKLLYEDGHTFWNFVHEEGLTRKGSIKSYSSCDLKLTDPFIKLGLIPLPRQISVSENLSSNEIIKDIIRRS